MSPLNRSPPARKTEDSGNIEPKKMHDQEVQNEATNGEESDTQMSDAAVTFPGGQSGSEEGMNKKTKTIKKRMMKEANTNL